MTKSAIEQAKLRMEEYAHEIALISSAYAYKHAFEAGLFKDYESVKDSITAMEELINILTGYKNNVKEPSSSSSKSADKSISDALQNQIDYYTLLLDAIEAVTDKQIDSIEKEKDAIDSKIDALEDEKDAIGKQIDALEDEKDALRDKNDEQQRELDLIEAQNNLDKAKKQKVFVYKEGEGLVQVQDEKAVKDAQKELDDVNADIEEAKIDKQIDALKKDQDGIDDQIDAYKKQQDGLDDQIDDWKAYRDSFSNMEGDVKDQLAIEQAKKVFGTDENGLLNLDDKTITGLRNGLAEAIYNKDVYDNKDNSKYVPVTFDDYLKSLGANVNADGFSKIYNSMYETRPVPLADKVGNSTENVTNNSSVSNISNKRCNIYLSPTIEINNPTNPEEVTGAIKTYLNKTLRTAINSIK